MPAIPSGASLPFDDDPPLPAAIPPGRGPDDSDGFWAFGTPVCPVPAAPVRVAPPLPFPLPFPLPLSESLPLPSPLPLSFPFPSPFPAGRAVVVGVGFASDPPPVPPFPPPGTGTTYTGESWVEGFAELVAAGCAMGELAGDLAVEEAAGVMAGRTAGAFGASVVVGGAAGDCVVAGGVGCAAAGVDVVRAVVVRFVVLDVLVFLQKGSQSKHTPAQGLYHCLRSSGGWPWPRCIIQPHCDCARYRHHNPEVPVSLSLSPPVPVCRVDGMMIVVGPTRREQDGR